MHIAIEGMDGAGKTSQAKVLAKRIGGEFIAKSFHEMHDTSGIYDSFVTIDKYTGGDIPGIYGIRQNYFFDKLEKKDVVTDRFYISNYWSRANDLSVEYFKRISMVWGEPDLMIILYADPETLFNRIYSRNNHDKDLVKPRMSEMAYKLMFEFVEQMNFKVLIIDNSSITFDETSDVIFYAYQYGMEKCIEKYTSICKMLQPIEDAIETESGKFICYKNELIECICTSETIKIPSGITCIRERAFRNCTGKIRIEIPESVADISAFAFEEANINEYVVDSNNVRFSSYYGVLYDKNIDILIKVPNLQEILVLAEVKKIENCAFAHCGRIKSVCVPHTVEKIGYAAFSYCKKLQEIIFDGDKVIFLAPGCFVGSNNIDDIKLDSIQYKASHGCIIDKDNNVFFCIHSQIKDNLTIDSGIYIYPYAYYEKIDVIELCVKTVKIGSFAFEKCKIDKLLLDEVVNDIGERSFGQVRLKKVVIPEKLKIENSWNNSFEEKTAIFVSQSNYEFFMNEKIWMDKIIWYPFAAKKMDLLCGNACVDFILKAAGGNDKDLIWISELVNYLEDDVGIRTRVFYYKSNLMNDYRNKVNCDHIDMKKLEDCICRHNCFNEKEMDLNDIRELKKQVSDIILCVRSEVLFNDEEFRGNNHYVVLDEIKENSVVLVSPGKEVFYKVVFPADDFMSLIKDNGQWIIGVGEYV